MGEYFDPNWRIQVTEQAKKELAKLEERVGTRADVIVESGDAPRTVCSIVGRVDGDVLVIGRGSAAGIFGRLRTNAYAIIRESPCPVVSV
jgi:nucleotide-binding universal stress UspA family protein